MSLYEMIKPKLIFLLGNFMVFLLIALPLVSLNLNVKVLFFIFVVWFLPLIIYMSVETIKLRRYYTSMKRRLEKLDVRYLLPSTLSDESYVLARLINEILSDVSRDMHEEVNKYKRQQTEYREYIERWVHEIKTPIASTKLIIENDSNDTTKKIENELKKIDGYIEQALFYARSNSVEKDYIIKAFLLKDVVTHVVKHNARDFIMKKIKLEMSFLNQTVYSDIKWVEFIINQIVNNALKYSGPDAFKLEIYCENKRNLVTLVIRDYGIGIPSSDMGRVFDKGFTGENGRLFGSATGMGLYLSHKLSDKLGLFLTIKSTKGEGTTVKLTFPLDASRHDYIKA